MTELNYSKVPNKSSMYSSETWLSDKMHYPQYQKVFAELNPTRLLEIGAYLGYSICSAIAGSDSLRWVDYVDDESGLKNSNELALENIRWAMDKCSKKDIHIFPWTNFEEVNSKEGFYCVCHIDANHQYQYVKKDLEFALSLKPKFIIGHDIFLENSGVEKAVREVCQKNNLAFWHTKELTHGLFLISLENQAFEPKSLKFVKG